MAVKSADKIGGHVIISNGGIYVLPGDGSDFQGPPDPKEWVYFLRCNEFVKIGYSTRVDHRISNIETSNPYPVELLKKMPGSVEDERAFHVRFYEYHHKLEWFRYEGKLKTFLDGDGS